MCGFAGIMVEAGWAQEGLEEVAGAMAEPLRHRGPDDDGTWVDEGGRVAFGFRRLSIFDLSPMGHQPMASGSGRFVIVFNGEIYNHPELREELRGQGMDFRSGSDTEVLLAGFERWGVPHTLKRSRGMFAMAVWDRSERRLWLTRDRLGIKPLFLYRKGGVIAFASELRSLHRVPGISLTVDMSSVASFLQFLYVPAPHTIFAEVEKVAPGTLVRIEEKDMEPHPEAFWSLADAAENGLRSPFQGTEEEAVAVVRAKLSDAVRIRLRADVPVGAFLSGGLDSSTVVALAQEVAAKPVRTFTVSFEDERFDEGPVARDIADRLGTRHTQVDMTEPDLLALVPRMSQVFDEPFADPSQLPTLLVSEVARRSVTVSLSGDGGDEVFAGYNRYLSGQRLLRLVGLAPRWSRALMARGVGIAAPRVDGRLGRTAQRLAGMSAQHRPSARLEKILSILRQDGDADRYRALLAVNPRAQDLVANGQSRTPGLSEAFRHGEASILRRMMLADQDGYVEDDLLPKLDRTSMAVSLEARVPMLDHEVVELSWSLPDHLLSRRRRGKWILREILSSFVPSDVIDRPKMGFSVPVEGWLRGPLREWAGDLLAPDSVSRAGLMVPEAVQHEWRELVDRGRGSALAVWSMAMLQAWWETWCGDRLPTGHPL